MNAMNADSSSLPSYFCGGTKKKTWISDPCQEFVKPAYSSIICVVAQPIWLCEFHRNQHFSDERKMLGAVANFVGVHGAGARTFWGNKLLAAKVPYQSRGSVIVFEE
jgi:hypothetical protein